VAIIGLRSLIAGNVLRAVSGYIAYVSGPQLARLPTIPRLEDFIRSRLSSGDSIRKDTLRNLANTTRSAAEISKRINRGVRVRPQSYPLLEGIPDCQGFFYQTIWEVDFPSEITPGETIKRRVSIDVTSPDPLTSEQLQARSMAAASDTRNKKADTLLLATALKFGFANPRYVGVVQAYRC
jgi:hypothetical protein